jgi:hypothetical protein
MSDKNYKGLTRCGLNADWSVSAWHFGTTPRGADGALYIIDNEDIDETFSIVRRWMNYPDYMHAVESGDIDETPDRPSDIDPCDFNDRIDELCTFADFESAASAAMRSMNHN